MKRFKLVVIAAVLCLMLGSAWLIRAQQTNRLLVIEGARLIDGTGRPPIENAVIVIAADTIQHFGIVDISRYRRDAYSMARGSNGNLEHEGKLVAARIFEAGPTFTVVGGHPIPTNRALGRAIDPRTLTQIDGPKTAVEEVRRYRSEYKVATIKTIMESGGVLGYPRMSVETLKALADEAHKLRLTVYAHAINYRI